MFCKAGVLWMAQVCVGVYMHVTRLWYDYYQELTLWIKHVPPPPTSPVTQT